MSEESSDQPDELLLLERVFLRLGSAESDEQLQSVLHKFLAPVLLKLSSQTDGVRKKVMELLVHVNKRVKSRPKVLLPVNDLILQYKNEAVPPFVTNFTILYIKLGFPRLESTEQVSMLFLLIDCLKNRAAAQQDSLLQLTLYAIPHLEFPSNINERKTMYQSFVEDKQITKSILDFFMDVLVMPYSVPKPSTADLTDSNPVPPPQSSPLPTSPPCLSEYSYKRVLGDAQRSPDQIEQIKLSILTLLGSEIFPNKEVICHFIITSADSRHKVASLADLNLKKNIGTGDSLPSSIITQLFALFLGPVFNKGKKNVRADFQRAAASISQRLKLFPYFLKSKYSANHFPASIQIVFESLYGSTTNPRLKTQAVNFVYHLCLNSGEKSFNPIGGVLLTGMLQLIGESKQDSKLRNLGYVAIGKIVSRLPSLVSKDLGLLQTFFEAMGEEESDNILAVQESLLLMAPAFKEVDDANKKLIEALLMQCIEKPQPKVRSIAVHYAKTVFSGKNIPSKYILILACGDNEEEIFTNASNSLLKPVTNSFLNDEICEYPDFTDMINYIEEKANLRIKSEKRYVIGNNTLAFPPSSYVTIVIYLRLCLANSAGISQDSFKSESSLQFHLTKITPYILKLLKEQSEEKSSIFIYINLIRKVLSVIGGAPAMNCLLEIVALSQQTLCPHLVHYLDWLKGFVCSSKEEMRLPSAELYALIISTQFQGSDLVKKILEIGSSISFQTSEGKHGFLIVLGYLVGRTLRLELRNDSKQGYTDELKLAIKSSISIIVNSLDQDSFVAAAACVAIGEAGRCGPFPVPNGSLDTPTVTGSVTKLFIVDKLVTILHGTKFSDKMRKAASVSLGYLCVGDRLFPHQTRVIDGLLECAQAKQLELHQIVGQSLVTSALGSASQKGRDLWSETATDINNLTDKEQEMVSYLTTSLLEKQSRSPNPHIRQASCIWLISLVSTVGSTEYLQNKLKEVQQTFMNFLSERDDITQSIASEGLGVVYEKCNKGLKDELVSLLVSTLDSGRKNSQKLTGTTKVFEQESLGKTPDGQNMSTYQELCSIASDLNKPDLIYKFMHLANHNATWNSKTGAALGFSTIAAQAGDQLASILHLVVPKLYRYQYDPNPKIQQTMSGIWSAIVPDSKKTTDQFLKEILSDLMVNLVNSQWRVRESSCLALSDLLRGRSLHSVIDKLPELWRICFRVYDDIKESVRKAAESACKTLSRVSIKLCDSEQGKVGTEATSLILPCLLKDGLGSSVSEVRSLSISTVVKISRSAGQLLKPHVPLIVISLLQSLSELEPQQLNYLTVRATENVAEKIDNARVAFSKTSPMMETVNQCVQYIDESTLVEIIPRISELLRTNSGLGSKAGCCNFIISLTHQCSHDLAQHAGKLLAALLNGLHDRNATIRKTYASTIGFLVKSAKDSSVEKLIIKLREWYMEKEDFTVHETCGICLHSIAMKSPDVFKRHAALALSFTFFASCKQNESSTGEVEPVSKTWEEIWLESTPGTEAGLRLYLTEIIDLLQRALTSQSWPMKAQAAVAMAKIADTLCANLTAPHLYTILHALLLGLPGRTWTGKEKLLKAISSICVSSRVSFMENTGDNCVTISEVLDSVIKECRKDDPNYKIEALRGTGSILAAHEQDRFGEVYEIITSRMDHLILDSQSKKEDREYSQDTLLNFQICAFDVLGNAWPVNESTQEQYKEKFSKLLLSHLNKSTWKVELSILNATKQFFSRSQKLLADLAVAEVYQLYSDFLSALVNSINSAKQNAIKKETLSILELIFKRIKTENLSSDLVDSVRSSLQTITTETADSLICDQALSLIKTI